jgi:hypothetical protein
LKLIKSSQTSPAKNPTKNNKPNLDLEHIYKQISPGSLVEQLTSSSKRNTGWWRGGRRDRAPWRWGSTSSSTDTQLSSRDADLLCRPGSAGGDG